jgi:cytochrome b involved in lipid metabolism
LLVLDDYILDVSTFASHHPGGGVLLRNLNLKSVDEEMKFHHPLTLIMANSMVIGTFKKEISRIIDPNRPLLPQIWDLDH